MPETILLTCLIIGSFGFFVWYSVSASLRIPMRYQIMFDSNDSYVVRVLWRRVMGFLMYFIIPWIVFANRGYSLPETMNLLGFDFEWNVPVLSLTGLGILAALILGYINSRQDAALEIYPEIRVRFWTPWVIGISIVSWILYIGAIEIFYRGFLFHSLLLAFPGNPALAIVGTTAMYGLTHYFKLSRVSFLSFCWSALACFMVYKLNSLWPVIIIHLAMTLFAEWFAIGAHREMFARRT